MHMQKRKLVIRPADLWHQPDFKDVHQMSVDERVVQNVEGSVLMLNDDCLLKILRYLGPRDLLRAEKACWRFRNVAEMIYKTYKVFNSEDHLLLKALELRSLIYNIGPYVETLKIKFHFLNRKLQVLRFAAQYCTNVKALHLCGIEVSYTMRNIQNLFRNLTKLEVEACSVNDKNLSYLMRATENKTVTELNLTSNQNLTGRCLPVFSNLRVANLYACSGLQPKYFVEFLRENATLEELNIVLCEQINEECIREVAKLGALKKLAISNGYNGIASTAAYSPLKQLTTLTHLRIGYVNYGVLDALLLEFSHEVPLQYLDLTSGHMTKSCLEALLNFKTLRGLVLNRKKDCDDDVLRQIARLRTLEELSIASCHNVTDDGVREVVRLNPKLRQMDVSSCQYLSPDLIPELVAITKGRPQVLTLRVGGTSISLLHDDSLEFAEERPAENLKLELASPLTSYPGSSDEASSDSWLDEFEDWDDDDSSDGWPKDDDDNDYAAGLFLQILAAGGI